MKNVVILGATGSIGQSTAKVARDIPERMRIVGMSAHRNLPKLAEMWDPLESTCRHASLSIL